MGTRTFSKALNPKSASWSHLGTKELSPLPPQWLGVESVHESSVGLFRWTLSIVTSYTLTQNVYVRVRAELYRETHLVLRMDPWSPQDPHKILLCASFLELG